MPELSKRPTSVPQVTRGGARSGQSGSRVLLVRQGVRSVRPAEEPQRTPQRLAIGVIVALGTVGFVWLIGHIGYRLGFAPMIEVPHITSNPHGGLITGILMLINVPQVILEAGLNQLVLLLAAMALIAIPAGGLSAIGNQQTPGGPKRPTVYTVFSVLGAATACITCIFLIWWTISTYRRNLIGELPMHPVDGRDWLSNLQIVAGLDILAVMAVAVWMVLVFRLHVPVWLKALAATVSLFTLVVVTVAMSISSGTIAQLTADRSVCYLNKQMHEPKLLLGSTELHMALLYVRDDQVSVELINRPNSLDVAGRESIVDFLIRHEPEE